MLWLRGYNAHGSVRPVFLKLVEGQVAPSNNIEINVDSEMV